MWMCICGFVGLVGAASPAVKLEAAWAFKSRIETASAAQLELTPQLTENDPFAIDGYYGFALIEPESFRYAFTTLVEDPNEDILFSPYAKCVDVLSLLWLQRMNWFVPSLDDIGQLRECLALAEDLVVPEAESGTDQHRLLAKVLRRLLLVAYSPRVELALRRTADPSAMSSSELFGRLADFAVFCSSLAPGSRLRAILDAAIATAGPVTPVFTEAERRVWWGSGLVAEVRPGSRCDPDLGHAGEFVNSVWAEAAAAGSGAGTLAMWHSLSRLDYDLFDEYRFESRQVRVMEDPRSVFMDRVFLLHTSAVEGERAWNLTVGAFLLHLEPTSQVDVCLASLRIRRIADVPMGSVVKILRLYNCVIHAIEDGRLLLPEDTEMPEHVATLMHMVWMTRNALSVILELKGHA